MCGVHLLADVSLLFELIILQVPDCTTIVYFHCIDIHHIERCYGVVEMSGFCVVSKVSSHEPYAR